MENEITKDKNAQENPHVEENADSDSTEALLEKYEGRSRRKADDVPAMQTVICVIVSAVIFALNAFYPEKGGEVFGKLKDLAFSPNEIIPNPIDLISELL